MITTPRILRIRRSRVALTLVGSGLAVAAFLWHSTPIMLTACAVFLAAIVIRFREAAAVIDEITAQFETENSGPDSVTDGAKQEIDGRVP
ncbi:hypothetical protein ACXR2T_07875 [Leucobacter sp. HY1910]